MREFVERQTLLNEDPVRVRRWFEEARAVAGTLGVELRLPNTSPQPRPDSLRGRARCDWPWRGVYVAYSGEAMPCCMVATPDRLNLGSMTNEGVVRVWNGEAYRGFRERLDSADPPDICKGCGIYQGRF
jgi:hypothetical protein